MLLDTFPGAEIVAVRSLIEPRRRRPRAAAATRPTTRSATATTMFATMTCDDGFGDDDL